MGERQGSRSVEQKPILDNRSRLWGSFNTNTHIALLTATFYVPDREERFSTFGARRHEAERLARSHKSWLMAKFPFWGACCSPKVKTFQLLGSF